MGALKSLTRPWWSTEPESTARDTTSSILGFMEEMPSTYYYFAMAGSIVASLYLFVTGRRWESLFVGLWAPTLINLGLFYKLIRPSSDT